MLLASLGTSRVMMVSPSLILIEITIKLCVVLLIMIDRPLSQIAAATIVKILIASLFKCQSITLYKS